MPLPGDHQALNAQLYITRPYYPHRLTLLYTSESAQSTHQPRKQQNAQYTQNKQAGTQKMT
jgi:hypothetical protein